MAWVVSGILLVLLATMPIGLLVSYSLEAVSFKLRIGFITFALPHKRGRTGQKQEDEPESKPPTNSKKNANSTKHSVLDYLPILRIVLDLLGRLRSKLVIRRLDFNLVLAGGDPCDLAVKYGRAQGVLATLLAQIENGFRIRKRNIGIACDFVAEQTQLNGYADISISFGKLLYLAVKYGILILKEYLTISNNKKAVQ